MNCWKKIRLNSVAWHCLDLWNSSTTTKTSAEEGLQTYSPTILFGLFKNATKCVSDPPKVVHFWTPHVIAFFCISLVERYSVSVHMGICCLAMLALLCQCC